MWIALQRAQALMERDGLDALIVSEKNNYWYFSGLISYQLGHIQRPQFCILPKRQAAAARLRQWQGESQGLALGWRGARRIRMCRFPKK